MKSAHLFPAVLLLAACATTSAAPSDEPNPSITETSTTTFVRLRDPGEPVSDRIEASAERVWQLVPDVYRELQLSARIMNADAMEYGNERISGTRVHGQPLERYFRCGASAGPASAGGLRVQFRIVTKVAAAGAASSELITRINASATPLEGTSTARFLCASTGALEEEIAKAINKRLK